MLYKLIELPTISDNRGDLTYINNLKESLFEVKRIFIVDNVPTGMTRGGHAHYKLKELLIPIKGNFTIEVSDNKIKKEIVLNSSRIGILLYPQTWRVVKSYTQGAICLSLCSEIYDEADYIRDWNDYCKIKQF